MFNLGAGEVLAIALIALIVLGPEKIPGALRQLGRFMGEIRRVSTGFQDELKNAMADDDDYDYDNSRQGVRRINPRPAPSTEPAAEPSDVNPALESPAGSPAGPEALDNRGSKASQARIAGGGDGAEARPEAGPSARS